jgi:hypothetical protein
MILLLTPLLFAMAAWAGELPFQITLPKETDERVKLLHGELKPLIDSGKPRPCRVPRRSSSCGFSSPAGATEISILAGLPLSFLNECGVPTGMLANMPAVATSRLPSIVNVISPSRT